MHRHTVEFNSCSQRPPFRQPTFWQVFAKEQFCPDNDNGILDASRFLANTIRRFRTATVRKDFGSSHISYEITTDTTLQGSIIEAYFCWCRLRQTYIIYFFTITITTDCLMPIRISAQKALEFLSKAHDTQSKTSDQNDDDDDEVERHIYESIKSVIQNSIQNAIQILTSQVEVDARLDCAIRTRPNLLVMIAEKRIVGHVYMRWLGQKDPTGFSDFEIKMAALITTWNGKRLDLTLT
ncbi:hypothetical protein BpHYR1_006643 [Brachionus plicatilis]|uniref:Uncharacterized protein n=1 Tax=Brachionus plicatilis TaxID=10195 RepID=A0A3M7P1I6_BRAPC|nr:hypothetical protein BpHYR1_006643 [Brachionus plicatilis]